eukprot:gene14567-biopygen13453
MGHEDQELVSKIAGVLSERNDGNEAALIHQSELSFAQSTRSRLATDAAPCQPQYTLLGRVIRKQAGAHAELRGPRPLARPCIPERDMHDAIRLWGSEATPAHHPAPPAVGRRARAPQLVAGVVAGRVRISPTNHAYRRAGPATPPRKCATQMSSTRWGTTNEAEHYQRGGVPALRMSDIIGVCAIREMDASAGQGGAASGGLES